MHYATKSGSLQLQMKKCPIDGLHMGTPQCIAWTTTKLSLYANWFHWIMNEFIGYNEQGPSGETMNSLV